MAFNMRGGGGLNPPERSESRNKKWGRRYGILFFMHPCPNQNYSTKLSCSMEVFLFRLSGIFLGMFMCDSFSLSIWPLLLLGLSVIISPLCVFIELHITTQPGPAKVCYTYESSQWGVVCNCVPLKGTAGFL